MDIGIFIPSYRRKKEQRTFESIPKSLLKQTHIVVDKHDYKAYKKRWGKVVVKCPKKGISKTRQWILENSEYKYALMLDDDMKFDLRANGKLVTCGSKDIKSMIKLLYSWLEEGILHVGISQRFGNNRIEESFLEVTRMNNAYAYDCKRMRKLKKKYGIGFDYLENKYNKRFVMEDFCVTLALLRRGYKNRVTYDYCWSQKQSGMKGGCSLYRTSEMQKYSAEAIAKEFYGFVSVVKKESKVQWAGFDSKIRTDVVIQWKKIFNTGSSNGITTFIR